MKMLTVRQPNASAIAHGWKNIENRSRITNHRGPLGIHAGKKWDDAGEDALRQVVHLAQSQGFTVPESMRDDPLTDTGLVLAVVDVTGVCTASRHEATVVCDCGPWARPRSTHWQLANPRVLAKPFPARGHEYLWDLDVPLDFRKGLVR
jgi:hypothetical protein